MSIRLGRFLTDEERKTFDEQSIAAGYYRENPAYLTPGTGWFQPWYYDPAKPGEGYGERGDQFLSVHYWRDWAHIRPPICIVGPNGRQWEIDRKSGNGDGWKVEGEWPNLTCTPSVVLSGYHGFLRGGEFTPDIEGRGFVGIPYVQPKRDDAP